MSFHVTLYGPKPCVATKKRCPVGGVHYPTRESAEEAFGRIFHSATLKATAKPHRLYAHPQKGGSYWGAPVDSQAVEAYVTRWRKAVGETQAEAFEAARIARDGRDQLHLTFLTPKDMRALSKRGIRPDRNLSFAFDFLGVGKAEDGDKETWFIIASSPEAQEWRASQGLPHHDFHVTLGFRGGDIHGVPKDSSTLQF